MKISFLKKKKVSHSRHPFESHVEHNDDHLESTCPKDSVNASKEESRGSERESRGSERASNLQKTIQLTSIQVWNLNAGISGSTTWAFNYQTKIF